MWEKLNSQQKDAIKAGFMLVAMLFVAVGAYWYYFVSSEVAAADKRVTAINVEIKDLQAKVREMDLAKANLEALKEKQRLLEEVASKLPSTVAPQEFYRAFEQILATTRVDYSELSQQALLERTVYTEIPYKIVGRGRYHDFGQFLNLIEENPNRLMRVKTFVIENDDNRPSVHPLQVELATFKFNKKG